MSGSTHRPGGSGTCPQPPGFLFWLSLIALATLASVLLTIDAAGDAPLLMLGPGVTLDEPLNVRPGLYHWRLLWDHGIGFWDPANTQEFFGDPHYLADYPPWGRIWLGFWHDTTALFFAPVDHPGPDVLNCARIGSAVAFALTVFLCGFAAQRWFGGCAGIVAVFSVAVMPRLWAHAHIAAVESVLNLAYSLVVVAIGTKWIRADHGQRRVPIRWALIGGLLWGLALLTKIQAVMLPFPLILWAFCVWRWRSIVPLALFGVTGLVVFYLGWPWLWLDPWNNFWDYFARTTDRISLDCFYLGKEWIDRDVPWHYPWVMFAVTVPIGLHALSVLGSWPTLRGVWMKIRRLRRSSNTEVATADEPPNVAAQRRLLLLLNIAFPLLLFSIPGIAVYDGERLFLMVNPLWGMLAGAGANVLWNYLIKVRRHSRALATCVMTIVVVAQTWGLFAMHPCQLNYFNLLTGGMRGAERLGFETCYWGDSVCRELLTQAVDVVPEGSTIDVAPVMHHLQLEELLAQSPILREHAITLRPFDDQHIEEVRYALVFRRRADPWESLLHPPPGAVLLAEVKREGVQLAALYEFTAR